MLTWKYEMKNVYVFLDIDGVLNSRSTHLRIEKHIESNNDISKCEKIRFAPWSSPNDFGNYIDEMNLNYLKCLEDLGKIKVILISSWTSSYNRAMKKKGLTKDSKDYYKAFSDFLGIEVIGEIDSTVGDGTIRYRGALDYINKHQLLNSNDYIVYLDDTSVPQNERIDAVISYADFSETYGLTFKIIEKIKNHLKSIH